MSEILVSLYKPYIASYSTVAILHFLGFLLLCKSKHDLPNQRLLTKNLALVELLFCMNMVTFYSVEISVHSTLTTKCLFVFFTALFFIEIRLTMLHIIFDRFLEIFTNIKYPLYMNHKKIMSLLAMHWFGSAVYAIISSVVRLLGIFQGQWPVQIFFCLILDIIILISAITTYLYFYTKVQKIQRLETSILDPPEDSAMTFLIGKFKQPCYIVLSYIFFNLTSTVMLTCSLHVHSRRQYEILQHFSHVPIIVGCISDASIYVFANRNVRKLLWTMFMHVYNKGKQ